MDWYLIYIIATLMIFPVLIYGVIAQSSVHSTFEKYSKIPSLSGVTAEEVSRRLLARANIQNVKIDHINGKLTDCYDPTHKVIKLSSSTSSSTSIGAIGVCAHEVGHAIQDAKGSFLFKLRRLLVPVCNFISGAFLPLIILGSILSFTFYIPTVGYYICLCSIISYGASLLFQLVTLPLEYDASKKSLQLLKAEDFSETEISQAKQVLNAAIHTYLAATLSTLVYFLRFLSYAMIFANNRD